MKLCALVLASAFPLLAGDTRPDFSGVWKRASGGSIVYTIVHYDPDLTIDFRSNYSAGNLMAGLMGFETYAIDGIERAGKAGANWTTVNWEGGSVVILRIVKDGYRVTVTRETLSLSADGRTLNRTKRTINMDGVTESSQTFEKQ